MARQLVQLLTDGGIAVALVLALALVYRMDKSPLPNKDPFVEVSPSVDPSSPPAKPLRLAVTPQQYDDMGKLLRELGEGYSTYTTIRLEELLDERRLAGFDVVFVTCGTVPEDWLGAVVGRGDREGTEVRRMRPEIVDRIKSRLRSFVEGGGTLYASDWRFNLVAASFPELAARELSTPGDKQEVNAEVIEPGLRDLLGARVSLHFDLPGWFPAAFAGREVTTYIKGQFRTGGIRMVEAPLLVKFPHGKGTVIFTSFHNEKQNSRIELALLRYLVFSAVTARVEAEVAQTMLKGGFSPQGKSILSASPDNPSVTRTYQCTKPGALRFVLGFENLGAHLRLSVVGPDGTKLEQQGASTVTIEVPNPAQGNWQYTITAVKVPYPNFPFTLTIGHK